MSHVQVSTSMSITKGNVKFRSYPNSFQASVVGSGKGPTPGTVACTVNGTDIDLTELTTPGFCFLYNTDDVHFVTVGVWDGTEFYPLLELGPGEGYPLKLSRFLGQSLGSVGTGTYDTGTYSLRIKADTAPCNVFVGAFER